MADIIEPISDERLAEIEALWASARDGAHGQDINAVIARLRKAEAERDRCKAELEWVIGWKMSEDDSIDSRLLRVIHRRAVSALKETGHD